jgi:hypothetical protein
VACPGCCTADTGTTEEWDLEIVVYPVIPPTSAVIATNAMTAPGMRRVADMESDSLPIGADGSNARGHRVRMMAGQARKPSVIDPARKHDRGRTGKNCQVRRPPYR